MKLYEQADRTGDRVRYSWMLDAPYRMRRTLALWKWVRGRPGCYVTNDGEAAKAAAEFYRLRVESNGSHAVVKAPMLLEAS